MNNDLISREALKKEFEKVYPLALNEFGVMVNKQIYDIIDNVPTVETEITNEDLRNAMTESFKNGYEMAKAKYERPQGEWIPVIERLPEYTGLYLICINDLVTVANFVGTYFISRGGGRLDVTAWQPLPEPYKKGGKLV